MSNVDAVDAWMGLLYIITWVFLCITAIGIHNWGLILSFGVTSVFIGSYINDLGHKYGTGEVAKRDLEKIGIIKKPKGRKRK